MESMNSQHLSNRLPVHHADERLWDAISSELDQLEAQEKLATKLKDLPVHKPGTDLWPAILRQMRKTVFLRITQYTTIAAAASLLVLLLFYRDIVDNRHTPDKLTTRKAVSKVDQFTGNKIIDQGTNIADQGKYTQIPGKRFSSISMHNTGTQVQMTPLNSPIEESPGMQLTDAGSRERIEHFKHLEIRQLRSDFARAVLQPRGLKPVNAIASIPAIQPDKKYYTPDPYVQERQKNSSHFALAANYLPESLDNGNGTSMFHNVGLTASIGSDKSRLQSSLGMAYNAEHRVYDVQYTQLITITNPHPAGGGADSTIQITSNRESILEGTERHQYLTYDLGWSRKIFTIGKMTTWVNTGAGVAFRLDNASLKESTIKTLNSYDSEVNSMGLEIPDYNSVNINLMTGFDFNYRILDRLSFSFAPLTRIYLKPVLEKNGSSTDSFSMGFRSGVKLDF
jgi:hypothetical protein